MRDVSMSVMVCIWVMIDHWLRRSNDGCKIVRDGMYLVDWYVWYVFG